MPSADLICDCIWEIILAHAREWERSGRELWTLGGGKKAKTFRIVEVTDDYLRMSALPSDKYSKEIFCRAVRLLYERGESGAELRPTKTSSPIPGTIDHAVRPPKPGGKVPPMRATWVGAILVHAGIATVVKRRPITIRLKDKYLRLKKPRQSDV